MKRGLFLCVAFSCIWSACSKPSTQTIKASFNYFKYTGSDTKFGSIPADSYCNPIISGFYPDPSICRKNGDYYLVNSSFSYFPGVPIWHSTDLINWKQIGYVLNRPSQLNIKDTRLSGGIYAPDIQYNPYNDMFYMITTAVDMGGNFIVKTKDPMAGQWSDPIFLPEVGGIDPSILFDNDGKTYIVNNDAPDGKAEYDGHRAIWIHEYDTQTDKIVGQAQVIVDKGANPADKPIWIEGPHLYHINGTYYLMAAEGGTGPAHSEVIFAADAPKGPFKPCKINPILTQRDLSENRPDPITCTGHADLIQTPEGKWFAVFLGCRPYEGDFYNTGRETFLLPVEWHEGQPVILKQGEAVPHFVKSDIPMDKANIQTGNFTEIDSFTTPTLSDQWSFIRTPQKTWWQIQDGALEMEAIPVSINAIANPAFVGKRQKHQTFEVETKFTFTPNGFRDFAGLVCYQNEKHYYLFGKTKSEDGTSVISLIKANETPEVIASFSIPNEKAPVRLKIIGNKDVYSFYVSFNNCVKWTQIGNSQDGRILSTHSAGGFTGTFLGLYTSSAQ